MQQEKEKRWTEKMKRNGSYTLEKVHDQHMNVGTSDLHSKRHKSHMLKHVLNNHPDMNLEHVQFDMKILSSHKTAFERQIREAVLIDKYAGPTLMNSKVEYNRC